MQKPDTSQRHRASRDSRWRSFLTQWSLPGSSRSPAFALAWKHCEGRVCEGDQPTRARRLAASTCASLTPGTCLGAASSVKAQAAQCMPSTLT